MRYSLLLVRYSKIWEKIEFIDDMLENIGNFRYIQQIIENKIKKYGYKQRKIDNIRKQIIKTQDYAFSQSFFTITIFTI